MLLCSWHRKKRMENGLERDVEEKFGEKEVDGERGASRRGARDKWRTGVSDVVNPCRQRERLSSSDEEAHTLVSLSVSPSLSPS